MTKGKYKRKREHAQQQTHQEVQDVRLSDSKVIPSKQQPKTSEKRDTERREKRKVWMRFNEAIKRSSFTDWCIAAFTCALTVVGYYQLNAMSGQLEEMRRSGRPYVFVGVSFTDQHEWDTQHTMPIDLKLINTGNSPAVDLVNTLPQIEIGPDALTKTRACRIDYPNSTPVTLPPNQSQMLGISLPVARTPVIDPEEQGRIKAHTDFVVVYGGVKYSGLGGGDFETVYCYLYNPKGIPFSPCDNSCPRTR
jgi:hypothetical protein